MLYLKNTTRPQTVYIPANGVKTAGALRVYVVNTIDRGPAIELTSDPYVYLVDADGLYVCDALGRQIVLAGSGAPGELPNIPDNSRLYYAFGVMLPAGMTEGEYEYAAEIDGEVVSTGLLVIGTPDADIDELENTVQYDQYND